MDVQYEDRAELLQWVGAVGATGTNMTISVNRP